MPGTTTNLGLTTGFVDGSTVYHGQEIGFRSQIMDTQIMRGYLALGAGVYPYPDTTSLFVTHTSGLNVSIAPGVGVIPGTNGTENILCQIPNGTPLTFTAPSSNGTYYLFLVTQTDTDPANKGTNSSINTWATATPLPITDPTPTLAGGLLLCELTVSGGDVTVSEDLRNVRSILTFAGAWSTDLYYAIGNIVIHSGVAWIAKTNNNNVAPVEGADWTAFPSSTPSGAAGGDLSGTYPDPTVAKVQGISYDTTDPTNGQVYAYNSGTGKMTPITLSGTGSVTSVGLILPASIFSVSGSPITSSGDLSGALINQSPNTIFKGPSSGGAAQPAFASLVNADLPDTTVTPGTYGDAAHTITIIVNSKGVATSTVANAISIAASQITSGLLALARGGTAADLSGTGGTNEFVFQDSLGAALNVRTAKAEDLGTGTPTSGLVLTSAGSGTRPSWTANGSGDVSGPGSATADDIATFNGTTGKIIKDSGAAVANVPATGEKAALAGTSGTPGGGNKYVTDADARNTNSRTPTAHESTHVSGGTDAFTSTDVLEAATKRMRETSGPTILDYGAIADTQLLARSGSTVVGTSPIYASVDISGSSNITLTADQANALFLRIFGTITGDVQVGWDNSSKDHIVYAQNVASGAHVVTAAGSGAGSTVTLTAGFPVALQVKGGVLSGIPDITIQSNTSVVFGTGPKTFTFQAGVPWQVGDTIRAEKITANVLINGTPPDYMEGVITSISSPDITVTVTTSTLSSTSNDSWRIILVKSVNDTGGGASNTRSVTQVAHGLSVGNFIKCTGSDTYAKAKADSAADSNIVGQVSAVSDADNFTYTAVGPFITLSSLTAGTVYFLDPSTAGGYTATEPSTTGQISAPVLIAITSTVAIQLPYRPSVINSPPLVKGLFDYLTTIGNVGTGEDDLHTSSVAANQLNTNGDKISFESSGGLVGNATATRELKKYFAGTAIYDSGAMAITIDTTWTMTGTIMRTSSTTARYRVCLVVDAVVVTNSQISGELTGLDFTTTNILKTTAQSAGTGGGSDNDVTETFGFVTYYPAA